jgi:hypothetical protein
MAYRNSSRSNSSAMAVARALGWFSIGLGLAEVLMPRKLTEQLGMEGDETLLQFYGAREIAAGVGILMSGNPAPWVWGRVAGDALDLATLARGLDEDNPRRGDAAIAFAAVAGVTALDAVCAGALGGPTKDERHAKWDYSDRRGMPKPPEAMRGAARDFRIPRDMRTPEALRSYTSSPGPSSPVAEHARA